MLLSLLTLEKANEAHTVIESCKYSINEAREETLTININFLITKTSDVTQRERERDIERQLTVRGRIEG